MQKNDMTILRSFSGSFFEVQVRLHWKPPHHRAAVRVRKRMRSVVCFQSGFGCPSEPIDELIELLGRARQLIGYLDNGGVLGRWNPDLLEMG